MTPVLELRDVWFAYDTDATRAGLSAPWALQAVDLSVARGAFVAFVGQNGAGKTTCAKHLNGILRPTRGAVLLDGLDTRGTRVSELARRVAYCYQNPDHQISALTVADELAFGPRNLGLPPHEIERRVEAALALADLAAERDSYPFQLGKGRRQKLVVAASLAMEPEILVVDEPTTGMDARGASAVMELLAESHRRGMTIIFVTHDMALVGRYAQRVVAFAAGTIVADGTPGEVFGQEEAMHRARLRPPQVFRLLGALGVPFPAGQVDVDTAVELLAAHPRVPASRSA